MEISVSKQANYWRVAVIVNGTIELQYRRNNKSAAVDCAFMLSGQYNYREPKLVFNLRG